MAYRSEFTGSQIDAAVRKSHKTGTSDPTTDTVGELGQRYFNTVTGEIFVCTAVITVDEVTTYTWRPLIANSLGITVPGQALDATKGKELGDLISTHTADLITDSDGAHGLKVEEGDWTPTLVGSSGTYNHTYTIRYGKYYKVGKKVHVVCQLVLSAKDATMAGGLNINGLPFTPNSNANYVIRNLIVSENVNQDNLVGSILPNNPTIRLNYITVNGALGTPTAAIISNTSALYINATYETN